MTTTTAIGLSTMSSVLKQLPRFNLLTLFRTTFLIALALATLRLLGPQKSWILFSICYGFAPTFALLSIYLHRNQSGLIRYGTAGLILLFFVFGMAVLCGLFYGVEAMVFVLIGTAIEWPGQIGILACLRMMIGQSADKHVQVELTQTPKLAR